MALSFTKGRPIARIVGGKYDGKILGIYDPSQKTTCCSKCKGTCLSDKKPCCKKCCQIKKGGDIDLNDPIEILSTQMYKNNGRKRLNLDQFEKIKYALMSGQEPLGGAEKEEFNKAKKIINDYSNKELLLYDGSLVPIPNCETRECGYACAASGGGKSTFVANYAAEYKKLFPKNDVFIFSRLESDDVLDKLKPKRIRIDDELVDKPIQPDELDKSLVIFDDTDTIREKNIRNAIISLKNDLLETGRHQNIYIMITSHLMNNYKETRIVLNESHFIVIFPNASSTYSIKYCLEKYYGLGKKDIEKVLKLKSRWIMIFRNFPRYVLSEHQCYILT